uniref:Protein phosphatase n=1 Tax=Syphacia muris TaxID=451379 RepID=A0A0N5AHL9_9BILA
MIRGRLLLNYGRLAFRAVISAGVVEHSANFSNDRQPNLIYAQKRFAEVGNNNRIDTERVHASCCGFPKNMMNGPSTVLDQGVFGDDACFIAKYKNTHIVGVADGVGGWRKYGVDPSEFSSRLMRICFELVKSGNFEPERPDRLLALAFETLSKPPRPVGSSTACVLVVHQGTLYTANLGDSGFLVIRDGDIVFRSREQQHYFNAPFQLSLPPADTMSSGFIGDSPEKAEVNSLEIRRGDIIVLATDGLWDNVPEHIIVEQLSHIKAENIQGACNALALTARRLAFDARHLSPFAVKASRYGIETSGGKPDDITLVLLMIA